ncbi:MAG: hypothetical protein ACRD1E_02530, partial [Terriglobales bacterium]
MPVLTAACLWAVLAPAALIASSNSAGSSNKDDDIARLKAATDVFRQVMSTPDNAIPEEILSGAQCIAIIPGE